MYTMAFNVVKCCSVFRVLIHRQGCQTNITDLQTKVAVDYWSVSNSVKWNIQTLAKYTEINYTEIVAIILLDLIIFK